MAENVIDISSKLKDEEAGWGRGREFLVDQYMAMLSDIWDQDEEVQQLVKKQAEGVAMEWKKQDMNHKDRVAF